MSPCSEVSAGPLSAALSPVVWQLLSSTVVSTENQITNLQLPKSKAYTIAVYTSIYIFNYTFSNQAANCLVIQLPGQGSARHREKGFVLMLMEFFTVLWHLSPPAPCVKPGAQECSLWAGVLRIQHTVQEERSQLYQQGWSDRNIALCTKNREVLFMWLTSDYWEQLKSSD